MSEQDIKYMQAALRLAKKGISSVEPNPAVGCIIVKDSKIIGRGYHEKFGAPHAEINALEDCKDQNIGPEGAVMYVNLEPCSHHGKTPPCTDAIIQNRLSKVIVAMIDPSEHARGKGIEQLRNAGIDVQIGLCEKEAKLLNAPFVRFAATGQCWVVLKWAQSIDGKITSSESRWISNEQSRNDAHRLRRRVGAILVGIETVLADDPLLTARPSKAKEAVRIVLDSNLRIPLDSQLLATAKKIPLLIAASKEAIDTKPQLTEKLTKKGAEILPCPTVEDKCDIKYLLTELSKRSIAQLLVEGGSQVITSFLDQNLGDEAVVYIAPRAILESTAVSITEPMKELALGSGLYFVEIERFGEDIRLSGFFEKALTEISFNT